jgi:hypothetical protein
MRLTRDFGRQHWGDEGYAREELVAELGSAFLCADLELTPEVRDDHAGYIAKLARSPKRRQALHRPGRLLRTEGRWITCTGCSRSPSRRRPPHKRSWRLLTRQVNSDPRVRS